MQQTTWEKEDRQPALQRLSPAQDQGEQRLAVNAFLTEHWGSTVMMVRGEQVDMSRLPGIFVEEQSQITALLTYRIQGERCEIISLDSVIGGRGVAPPSLRRQRPLRKRPAAAPLRSPPQTTT